jgi:hypothetical protein
MQLVFLFGCTRARRAVASACLVLGAWVTIVPRRCAREPLVFIIRT